MKKNRKMNEPKEVIIMFSIKDIEEAFKATNPRNLPSNTTKLKQTYTAKEINAAWKSTSQKKLEHA